VRLTVAGRGGASLHIAGSIDRPRWTDEDFQFGAGLIAVSGMAGLLAGYRGLRRRTRGLGAIREALRTADTADASLGSLRVSEGFGAEARSWNRLLMERDALRRQAALRGARVRPVGPVDRRGEVVDLPRHGLADLPLVEQGPA
jgi:hypothetical protein